MTCIYNVDREIAAQHANCASCGFYRLSHTFPNKCEWDWSNSSNQTAILHTNYVFHFPKKDPTIPDEKAHRVTLPDKEMREKYG